MNSFADFKDIMGRLLRTPDNLVLRVENTGFVPGEFNQFKTQCYHKIL